MQAGARHDPKRLIENQAHLGRQCAHDIERYQTALKWRIIRSVQCDRWNFTGSRKKLSKQFLLVCPHGFDSNFQKKLYCGTQSRYAGQIQGAFTPNESSTAGMLLALQDINKAGKVAFIGFDVSDTFIDAIRNKQLQGIVVQNPFRMGDLGVKTMVDHLQGKPVEKRIDTGVMLVTSENMESAEAQQLLHPPLSKYLSQ